VGKDNKKSDLYGMVMPYKSPEAYPENMPV